MPAPAPPSPDGDAALPREIAALLAPGEKVLWLGRPRPYVFMLRGLTNLAYGVTWSVLGAFWYHGAGGIGRYSAFQGWWRLTPLFSLPFILAGFSFFFAPIRLGARARRTWHLVTNRRVFLAEARKGSIPHLCVFTRENLAALQVRKRSGGLEDLLFSRRAQENPHLVPRLEAGFFGVENGERALEAIRTAQLSGANDPKS
jgi:hypothetical protein